ncbi:MAG: hypothetical protein U0931_12115 [Vulcanimicrobiota bacterium]
MATAMDIVHCFKPAEHLDQAIYRDLLKSRQKGSDELRFVSLLGAKEEATLVYEVLRLPQRQVQSEYSSLGKVALTALLFTRALLTGKSAHWAGAISAGAFTLIDGEETLQRARGALQRIGRAGSLGKCTLRLTPNEAVLVYEGQQVHISLAPMRQVVLRPVRGAAESQEIYYCIHIDLQDGRVLPVIRSTQAVEARRLAHQLAKALHLTISSQYVDVMQVPNGYSWEMGPQLAEPALN